MRLYQAGGLQGACGAGERPEGDNPGGTSDCALPPDGAEQGEGGEHLQAQQFCFV